VWTKKLDCAKRFSSVLSMSVSVECGVLSVEYDSAVSGEPPLWVRVLTGTGEGYPGKPQGSP
jgi:hypothetical protein